MQLAESTIHVQESIAYAVALRMLYQSNPEIALANRDINDGFALIQVMMPCSPPPWPCRVDQANEH